MFAPDDRDVISPVALRAVYDHFADSACAVVARGEEVMPQLFMLAMSPDALQPQSVAALPEELTRSFYQDVEGKERLAAFVRALLTPGHPMAQRLAEEIGAEINVLVQISEAWYAVAREAARTPAEAGEMARKLEEYGSVEHMPDRQECVIVHVHTRRGSLMGLCPIESGPPRRATKQPPNEGEFIGYSRFSVDDPPRH